MLAKELANKGYDIILSVSKKGVKPNETDFSDILDEIKKCLKNSLYIRKLF